jgi:uncharacterized protein YcbK (DUF882 family)
MKYFTENEIACRCGCGQAIEDHFLIFIMEIFRKIVELPIIVHSVNRCTKYNQEIGGVSHSLHLTGSAMDFHVKGMTVKKLHKIAKNHHNKNALLFGGLGFYSWGLHADVGKFRKWKGK